MLNIQNQLFLFFNKRRLCLLHVFASCDFPIEGGGGGRKICRGNLSWNLANIFLANIASHRNRNKIPFSFETQTRAQTAKLDKK